MVFNSIKEIQDHNFVGNHFSDHPAFMAIGVFVKDEKNSFEDRGEAIRIMSDKGMGCGRCEDFSDLELIEEYVRGC